MLEVRRASFGYGASDPVFSRLEHCFRGGEMVAITGPSGIGKSTLLYMLGLMLRPQAGAVFVEGTDCSKLRDGALAALRATKYGFVFQDAALDPSRSVLDNVLEPAVYRNERKRDGRAKALDLLDRFGVKARASHKPGQISGGQAQRISLCRALHGDPPILLADEPTGNLDAETASLVMKALREQANAGSVVVFVTHDPAMAVLADRTVTL